MKISKKLKKVKRLHKNCHFVDKWGRQYSIPDIRIILYRAGNWVDVTFSQIERPEKLWRIQDIV